MLEPQTLGDLHRAWRSSPGGFLIVDSGTPKFAVIDYETFKSLKQKNSEKSARRILVTGGAGYIGSHTVRVLQKKGYGVVVFDNLSTGRREAVHDAKFITADLADTAALDKVFREEKIDTVMHFAASIEVEESVANPEKYYQNNVVNGLNLLNAMVKHNVKKIVFSSSAAVYGEPESALVTEGAALRPVNPYGESKHVFEQALGRYAGAYGLSSVSLRYFNAAGAWPEEGLGYAFGKTIHLIPRVLDVAAGRTEALEVYGDDYPTPNHTCIRDYIHVLDLAEAHILALEFLGSGGPNARVYNVGTGKGNSVLEVIEAVVEVTGRMIPMRYRERRPGDPARIVADASKLRRELGWQPKYNLTDMIASSWQWHQKNSSG